VPLRLADQTDQPHDRERLEYTQREVSSVHSKDKEAKNIDDRDEEETAR
jgi:hypothetical protein